MHTASDHTLVGDSGSPEVPAATPATGTNEVGSEMHAVYVVLARR